MKYELQCWIFNDVLVTGLRNPKKPDCFFYRWHVYFKHAYLSNMSILETATEKTVSFDMHAFQLLEDNPYSRFVCHHVSFLMEKKGAMNWFQLLSVLIDSANNGESEVSRQCHVKDRLLKESDWILFLTGRQRMVYPEGGVVFAEGSLLPTLARIFDGKAILEKKVDKAQVLVEALSTDDVFGIGSVCCACNVPYSVISVDGSLVVDFISFELLQSVLIGQPDISER